MNKNTSLNRLNKGLFSIHTTVLKKADWGSLKLNIDKSDINKLETTPGDLSKRGKVVQKEFVKKDLSDEFRLWMLFILMIILI